MNAVNLQKLNTRYDEILSCNCGETNGRQKLTKVAKSMMHVL